MSTAIVIGCCLVFAIALYVVLMIWDAKHSVSDAPRSDMFVCDRHGAVPMKYAVKLDMAGITDDPIPFCPFCYDQKVEEATKKYRKK